MILAIIVTFYFTKDRDQTPPPEDPQLDGEPGE
jgi:hypothetical protein